MSGFVGYDAERVQWLRDAMVRAVDELRDLRTNDQAASPALARIRRTEALLGETWIPRLDGLLRSCVVVTPARSVLDVSPIDLPDLADIVELLGSDEGLAELAAQLDAIATDPRAAAAVRAGFAEWETLVHLVAEHDLLARVALTRDPDDAESIERLALLDGVLAGLGGIVVAGTGQAHHPAAPPVLAELDPYAAALLLPHLGLSGALLAETATRIVRRWHDWPAGSVGWMDSYVGGDNTADLVFRVLADDERAATIFLQGTAERPDTLFVGVQDPRSLDRLVRVGLDPAHVDAAIVGSIVPSLVAWQREHEDFVVVAQDGGAGHGREVMAGVIADWVLYVGARADEWDWTYDEADGALRWVIGSDEGLRVLLDRLISGQHELGDIEFSGTDGRVDDAVIREQTTMFAQLEVAIADEQVADAVDDVFWLDLAAGSAQMLVGRLVAPVAGPVVSTIRDFAISQAAGVVRGRLGQDRIIPPSPDQIRAATDEERTARTVERAVVATITVVAQLVELGELDAAVLDDLDLDAIGGGCTTREVSDRLHEWVEGFGPQLSPVHHNVVVAVLNGFLNQDDVVDACD